MKKFTTIMPPPNVTGGLHIGHALTYTLQSFFIQYKKLRGYNSYWQPGYDHAGIAMQMISKKKWESQGRSINEIDDFIKFMHKEKEISIKKISQQIDKMKMAVNWKNAVFTLDEGPSKAVIKAFVDMYNDGIIYKDKRLINWDSALQTSISNLEIITKQVSGNMYYIKYYFASSLNNTRSETENQINNDNLELNNQNTYITNKYIVVATTRPETIFGDTAIAISNILLKKYPFLDNKEVFVPITNKKIKIIIDDYSDPNKGSGFVKITPAHDFNDFEVGKRHKLDIINIFDKKMHLITGPLKNKHYKEARKLIVELLNNSNYIIKTEQINQLLPFGDRSGEIIEPRLSNQWFVDTSKISEKSIEVVEKDYITFEPYHWKNTYLDWMKNIEPWCISRQLIWGHRIPAWYDKDNNIYVAINKHEAQKQAGNKEIFQDNDVLDTWFSSGLWSFSSLGWPDNYKFKKDNFPSDVLVTGFDIIFFWVARMIMMSLYFTNSIPFKKVYIAQIILDKNGNKMSKTKGNTIDPLTVIEKYSSNELRLALLFNISGKRHMNFGDQDIVQARNFMTKLKNACKFCDLHNEYKEIDILSYKFKSDFSIWILNELFDFIKSFYNFIDNYKVQQGLKLLKEFIWNKFCAWYIEYIKVTLYTDESYYVLNYVKNIILKILNTITPEFVENQKYQDINIDEFTKNYTKMSSKKAEGIIKIVSEIRSIKSIIGVDQSSICKVDISYKNFLIENFAKVKIENLNNKVKIKTISIDSKNIDIFFDKSNNIFIDKKIVKVEKEIKKLEKILNNDNFIKNASCDVVENNKEKLKILKEEFIILFNFK